ncbi:hypothetical protein [Gulosibacter molinativorax]|uniref:Glutaminase n=1 Tax=Gulosibacter molinativorax TaxID=256821 RepID=A0ABT7C5R9_9MICO|nr:hypothetical protein [Gulosibacter molinativorax]MDJ1370547.1 hypothetical protein [Gulosibacter molinativorax]QUY62040.1 Hypotetical protein [Gulosibacter molinativorax]
MSVGERLRSLATLHRDALLAAGIATEAVGEYEAPRRRFLILRPERIAPLTRAWRLGVLLIDEDGNVRAAGATLRAHEPPPILGYASESARRRDAMRHAAIRGGFAEGETVHFDTALIDESVVINETGPVSLRDGELVVRWHTNTPLISAIPLARYLSERVDLLMHPPQGAT